MEIAAAVKKNHYISQSYHGSQSALPSGPIQLL